MAIDNHVKNIYFTTCSFMLRKLAFMKRKTFFTWISDLEKKGFGKEGNSLDIEYVLKLIANNGFPLVLSVYLVWKLAFLKKALFLAYTRRI